MKYLLQIYEDGEAVELDERGRAARSRGGR
jgi:hypothetical protein